MYNSHQMILQFVWWSSFLKGHLACNRFDYKTTIVRLDSDYYSILLDHLFPSSTQILSSESFMPPCTDFGQETWKKKIINHLKELRLPLLYKMWFGLSTLARSSLYYGALRGFRLTSCWTSSPSWHFLVSVHQTIMRLSDSMIVNDTMQ